MTLTTHAIVGAAAAQFFPSNPILGFFAGFVSHFMMDSLPHWDYKVLSIKQDPKNFLKDDMDTSDKKFFIDLIRIGSDFWLGIILSFLIFSNLKGSSSGWLAVIGAVGGITPDPLQFLYWKIRREPLTSLQRFHVWIQKDRELKIHPLIGIALQLIVVSIVLIITNYLI